METDWTFFAFAIPAIIFAGISKGGFGSGAAFAATPLLALILPPEAAVGLMLPLLMLMDLSAIKPYWRKWRWRESRVMMLGSVPGVMAGALFFGIANPDGLRLIIGFIAVGFVAFGVARSRGWIRLGRRSMPFGMGYVFGALAGFTSFISHAGGPPAAVYMLARNMSKTEYQASSVIVFWCVNLLKFGPFVALGMITTQMWLAWLVLAPFALFGIWLGVVAHHRIPERLYFQITYALLLITGSKLIWDALT